MTPEETIALVETLVAQLGEHFDAVQILATRTAEGGGTESVQRGVGNWYARQGMAHEFIEKDRAQEHAIAIVRANKNDE